MQPENQNVEPSNPEAVPMPPAPQNDAPQPQGQKLESAFKLFGKSVHAWGVNIKTYLLLFLTMFAPMMILVVIAFSQAALKFNANPDTATTATAGINAVSVILGILGLLLFLYLIVIFTAASYKVMLCSARDQRIGYKEAFSFGRKYGARVLGLGILVFLVIFVGLILLIVPGIFMIKRYYLAPYYLIDQDLGVMEAMKKCAADSKTFSMAIWGMLGVMFLFTVLGFIPLVGIITGILSLLYSFAPAVRYNQIQQALGGSVAPTPATDPMPAHL